MSWFSSHGRGIACCLSYVVRCSCVVLVLCTAMLLFCLSYVLRCSCVAYLWDDVSLVLLHNLFGLSGANPSGSHYPTSQRGKLRLGEPSGTVARSKYMFQQLFSSIFLGSYFLESVNPLTALQWTARSWCAILEASCLWNNP